MSGQDWGGEGFEAPRTSVEVRDATPKASTRIGNAVHLLQSTIGSPGSVVSCSSRVWGGAAATNGFLCVSKFQSVAECLLSRCLS